MVPRSGSRTQRQSSPPTGTAAGEISLSDIAGRIGDKHDTVKRMVNAIYVLEQARVADVFRIDDRWSPRFNFSHLYTALSRAPYMQFLGLDAAWARFDPTPNPVPGDRVDRLTEVFEVGVRLAGRGC